MGRRKIEIEPITNERNRSVTFLKRKNGLFKKAYELGVLCSVDIAVIVFEERPGHAVKLHQYCSGNVHNVIQRHLRHEGVRECRGPHDYNDKLADGDDDDDEALSEEEPIPSYPTTSRSVKAHPSGSHAHAAAHPRGRAIPKHHPRPADQAGPSAKRARLALALEEDQLVSELTGAGAYRFPGGLPPPHAHAHAPAPAPGSAAGLAGLYPPPSSHAWSSVVAGTLAGAAHAQGYAHHHASARAQAYAQQYQGQYALSQSASPPHAGPFDLSVPPPPPGRAGSYGVLGRHSEPAYSAAAAASAAAAGSGGAGAHLGDVFDFDWPVHQPPPPPPPLPAGSTTVAASALSAAASTSSNTSQRSASAPAHVKQPSSPDLTWLDFLSGPSPPALGQPPAAANAARAQLSPLGDGWDAEPGSRPGSGSGSGGRTAGSFLPSPRSERDEDEEVWAS